MLYIYIYIFGFESSVLSTENNINTRLAKEWPLLDRLSVIWKSYLSGKIKSSFFQAAVMSIQLYRRTTWTLTKCIEKKLDGKRYELYWINPAKQQLFGHLPHILKTIQIKRTRQAGDCMRSKDEIISDVLQWTPLVDEQVLDDQLEPIYNSSVWTQDENLEDLPNAMDDRDEWCERVWEIRASRTTRYIYIYFQKWIGPRRDFYFLRIIYLFCLFRVCF